MIPVLMITHNRLEYTKQALRAVLQNPDCCVLVVDNGSTDGTAEFLSDTVKYQDPYKMKAWYNDENEGIAGAMNRFLDMTIDFEFVAKVDNDTVISYEFFRRMMPHMSKADIVQAKHPLIKASGVGTFDEWTSKMPADGALRFNHFVGGSGIMFRRSIVDRIPETAWKIGGWRQWQREHPEVKKAFATDVSIQLLDTNEDGEDYSMYPEYYKQTGRI